MVARPFFIGQVERYLTGMVTEAHVIGIQEIFGAAALIEARLERAGCDFFGQGEQIVFAACHPRNIPKDVLHLPQPGQVVCPPVRPHGFTHIQRARKAGSGGKPFGVGQRQFECAIAAHRKPGHEGIFRARESGKSSLASAGTSRLMNRQ